VRKRYRSALEQLDRLGLRPGIALRQTLATGYGRRELARDALAGLVVGVVALPLSMTLAIASGVAKRKALVILSGVQPQPKRVLERAGLGTSPGRLQFATSMQEAAQQARVVLTPTSETPVAQPASTPGAGTT